MNNSPITTPAVPDSLPQPESPTSATRTRTRAAGWWAKLAVGLATAFLASTMVGVATAAAEEMGGDVISTECGAGTITACGSKPYETCDWVFDISFDRTTGFHIKIGRTECKVTGSIPIYKDKQVDPNAMRLECNLLSPFLGMPSGCTD